MKDRKVSKPLCKRAYLSLMCCTIANASLVSVIQNSILEPLVSTSIDLKTS